MVTDTSKDFYFYIKNITAGRSHTLISRNVGLERCRGAERQRNRVRERGGIRALRALSRTLESPSGDLEHNSDEPSSEQLKQF